MQAPNIGNTDDPVGILGGLLGLTAAELARGLEALKAGGEAVKKTPAAQILLKAIMESGRRGGPGRHLYTMSPEGQERFWSNFSNDPQVEPKSPFPTRTADALWQAPRMPWEWEGAEAKDYEAVTSGPGSNQEPGVDEWR